LAIKGRCHDTLVRHPRFTAIPRFEDRLLKLLLRPLDRWDHPRVVDALAKSPQAYMGIERMFGKIGTFLHHPFDEVDTYDTIADDVFHRGVAN
jgi:hypothetical protein